MSVGKKIKQFRELRDYTQSYMADRLDISTSGYGKIERDETDITISRLTQIAEILETKMEDILEFKPSNIFNQNNNNVASGFIRNIQVINETSIKECFDEIKKDIAEIKKRIK